MRTRPLPVRARWTTALASLLWLVAAASPARAEFRTPPWLVYPGDPSRMRMVWQCAATETCRVTWSTDASPAAGAMVSREDGPDHLHVVTLANLVPGEHYRYCVTGAGAAWDGTFTAAPAPDARRVSFLAYGDTRTYPADDDSVCAAMLEACAAQPELQSMLLYVGDFVLHGGDPAAWAKEFLDPRYTHVRALAGRVPYQACVGNHDATTPRLMDRYFPYPWSELGYGAFDYGPVHVAVVNQYLSAAAHLVQLDWLDRDLAATRQPWKVVLLHEPGWAADGGHPNNTAVQDEIQPLCRRHGVAILFAGHNHYYARAMVDGVAHVTTGGGGAPLYTPELPAPHVVRAARGHHFCTVAVDGDTLRLVARTVSGARLDSLMLVRGAPRHRR